MTPEDSARLGGLLLGQRLVALGVVAEGEPIVGLLPYAVTEDRTALVVQPEPGRPLEGPSRGPCGAG
jgi:hypothetical protein